MSIASPDRAKQAKDGGEALEQEVLFKGRGAVPGRPKPSRSSASDGRAMAIPRGKPPGRLPDDLGSALSSLARLNIASVRGRWRAWLGDEPPRCQSGRILRLLLAWRVQEARFGGLSVAARRQLRQIGDASDRKKPLATPLPVLKRGMVLAREWKGVMHRVQVLEKGFAHQGNVYATLSEAARAITGTRWSGPRFFGIRSGSASRSQP